ncbi:hypothetical protein DESHY_20115 [Desulforamulus hydrothermalis Lam5 = DSM 18033]|uniref:Uncharacterized protein n=1 Tax=Desulforamulus hydrothermalis Lam5 = DSM 18033 TaxID=1121428 RepID=K8EHZ2_9FIRM|nr:hypothetical protein DESHY_20115 [Desulforamulus hydrothermalis Lam5 = DSM 18033]
MNSIGVITQGVLSGKTLLDALMTVIYIPSTLGFAESAVALVLKRTNLPRVKEVANIDFKMCAKWPRVP